MAFDFKPDRRSSLELDEGQRLAWANGTKLELNFLVNADFGGFVQAAVYNILDRGEGVSRDWHVRSGVEKRDSSNEKSSATVRLWCCSMRSYDQLRWFLNPKPDAALAPQSRSCLRAWRPRSDPGRIFRWWECS
jgi:hypothetical protein